MLTKSKRCTRCKKRKTLKAFYARIQNGKSGHHSMCKDCYKIHNHEYHKKHTVKLEQSADAVDIEFIVTDADINDALGFDPNEEIARAAQVR